MRGLVSFPVTPFTAAGDVDLARFRAHLRYLIAARPSGLFVCGGTGEFFSLTPDEYRALVRAAVEEARGDLPIVAAAGYGTRLACAYAVAAEEEGADGILVLPPYLVQAEQEGLYQHYRAVAAVTSLGVILYQRDNAIFAPATVSRLADLPTVVGFKDGHGDMDRLIRIGLAAGDRLLMMNGMPTAEISGRAFFGAGVSTYSSAVFNFVPEIAQAFYVAISSGDDARVTRLLEGFYRPFADLRDRVRGYAIALIKAGVAITSRPVGSVRPPLLAPTPEHEAELRGIVARGLALVAPEAVEGRR
ncbi:MAG: 5-dehydro-4-deoxyglucarate dehydratase [Chloroflexota bacterium]